MTPFTRGVGCHLSSPTPVLSTVLPSPNLCDDVSFRGSGVKRVLWKRGTVEEERVGYLLRSPFTGKVPCNEDKYHVTEYL